MEKIFSHAWKGRHGGNVVNSTDELVSDDSVALPQENDEVNCFLS